MAASPGGQEVGRVSVRVVPDTSRFGAELQPKLVEIETRNVVNIRAELDTAGLVEHAKAAVTEANAAVGNVHVGVDVDRAALGAAVGGLGALLTVALTLGPTLIPLGAAIVGAFAPVLAIFGAAAAGAGAFGAVLIPQLVEIVKARKAQADAEKAYNKATTDAGRKKALADEAAALAGLSPAQLAASKAMDALSGAFSKFTDALAPTVLPVFTQALDLLGKSIPLLVPFVRAATTAFSTLLTQLGTFATSKEGQSLLDFFAGQVGPAIVTLGTVFGNVFVGIGNLLKAFGPLIAPVEAALVRASAAFANFSASASTNQGFQAFLAYVQQVGPQVVTFFGAFIDAVGKLLQGLAPLGGPILAGLTKVLTAFSNLPTPVVTALAVGIVAVVVSLQALAIVMAVIESPIILVAVAIGVLVAAIVYAYTQSKTFRTIVQAVFGFIAGYISLQVRIITTVVTATFNAVRAVITAVMGVVRSVVTTYIAAVIAAFNTVRNVVGIIRDAFEAARAAVADKLRAVVTLVTGIGDRITGALGDLGDLLFDKGAAIIQGLIDGILSKIKSIGGAMGKVAGTIGKFIPGSPVREGPLKVLNNGRSGGLIATMLAEGIVAQRGAVASAMSQLAGGGASGLGLGGGVGASGHSITVNEARGETTPAAILRGLAMAEALTFSPG